MATTKKKMTYGPDGQTQVETETQPAAPAPGEHISFFDDDEGDGLYSGTILIDGVAVRVRELSAGEVDRYKADQRSIDDIAVRTANGKADFAKIFDDALTLLDLDKNNSQAVAELREKDQSGAEDKANLTASAISVLKRASCVRVITSAVTGWDLKRPDGKEVPFSREMALKLRFSKQEELVGKIVQRSVFGVDFSGFLAPS